MRHLPCGAAESQRAVGTGVILFIFYSENSLLVNLMICSIPFTRCCGEYFDHGVCLTMAHARTAGSPYLATTQHAIL